MHCDSAKEISDKLNNVYQGDEKVKGSKLQTYRGQLEHLNIKEDEETLAYFLQVDEVMNTMREMGDKIVDKIIVQKILRSPNEI